MKDFSYYSQVPEPYPDKKDFNTHFFYGAGRILFDHEKYNRLRAKYQEAESKLMTEFANDLFVELGIEKDPGRFVIYSQAWENGHAYGLSQVFYEAQDLVEMIEKYNEVRSKK